MGPWGTRLLDLESDMLEAVADVGAWGFPRPIDDSELEGVWYRMGKGVVWWYEKSHDWMPGAAWCHLAVAPRLHGGAWPVRRWTYAVELEAEILGAEALIFAPLPNQGQILKYLTQLHWKPWGQFWLKALGG